MDPRVRETRPSSQRRQGRGESRNLGTILYPITACFCHRFQCWCTILPQEEWQRRGRVRLPLREGRQEEASLLLCLGQESSTDSQGELFCFEIRVLNLPLTVVFIFGAYKDRL